MKPYTGAGELRQALVAQAPTRRIPRLAMFAATFGCLAMGVVGCAGTNPAGAPDPSSAVSDDDGESPVEATSSPPVAPSSATPDNASEPSPLEAAWARISGAAGSLSEEETDALRAKELEREELIAVCMAAQGFDYVPAVVDQSALKNPTSAVQGADLDPIERARQFGYGFIDEQVAALEEPPQVPVDPNEAIRELLSPDGAAQWTAARAECDIAPPPVEVADDLAKFNDPVFQEFDQDSTDLAVTIALDPRSVTLESSWSNCLSDAGFPSFTFMGEQGNYLSDLWESRRDLPGWVEGKLPDPAWLQDVRAQEIALAVADETCQKDLDYVARTGEVRREYESAFVAERSDDIAYLEQLFAS